MKHVTGATVLLVASLCAAGDVPTAAELLDRYGATLDRLTSVIVTSKYAGQGEYFWSKPGVGPPRRRSSPGALVTTSPRTGEARAAGLALRCPQRRPRRKYGKCRGPEWR